MDVTEAIARHGRFERARADAERICAAHDAEFGILRRASSRHFGRLASGKSYSRTPALKITIPSPALGDEPEAKLVIQPRLVISYRDSRRSVAVDAEHVHMTLCHIETIARGVRWHERLKLHLSPDGGRRVSLVTEAGAGTDSDRLCAIVVGFLDDPAAVIATSGTHCVYCGRGLTDPDSRARGIGPECFGKNGDFIALLVTAPDVLTDAP